VWETSGGDLGFCDLWVGEARMGWDAMQWRGDGVDARSCGGMRVGQRDKEGYSGLSWILRGVGDLRKGMVEISRRAWWIAKPSGHPRPSPSLSPPSREQNLQSRDNHPLLLTLSAHH
jgi:hypothetical protein